MQVVQQLTLWEIGSYVAVAGLFGGFINAVLLSVRGLPADTEGVNEGLTTHGWRKWLRDYTVNPLLGAVAALLSWSTYGPYGAESVFASQSSDGTAYVLTLTTISTAVIIGIGGARWLTNEVDKRLLQTAASAAQNSNANPDAAQNIQLASPEQAVNIARNAP